MSDDGVQVQRLRRPSWRDPRLGVGVLLVAGSVALGSWAVAQADQTVDVYVAVGALTPGDRLDDAQLRAQAVRPDGLEDAYLRADTTVLDDAVVTRVVGAGELVPAAAVGRAADIEVRPVVISVTGTPPSGVDKGAAVDLWLTSPVPPGSQGDAERAAPTLLAGALVVAEVLEGDSLFSGAGSAVQVLVPQGDLPAVLDALSGEGEIVVVPVPGGGS